MTTTFCVKMFRDEVKAMLLNFSWHTSIERMSKTHTNITFEFQKDWDAFEEYAEAHGIEYELV